METSDIYSKKSWQSSKISWWEICDCYANHYLTEKYFSLITETGIFLSGPDLKALAPWWRSIYAIKGLASGCFSLSEQSGFLVARRQHLPLQAQDGTEMYLDGIVDIRNHAYRGCIDQQITLCNESRNAVWSSLSKRQTWQPVLAERFSANFCVRFQYLLVRRAKYGQMKPHRPGQTVHRWPSASSYPMTVIFLPVISCPASRTDCSINRTRLYCIRIRLTFRYRSVRYWQRLSAGPRESSSNNSTILFIFGMVRLKPRMPQVF